MKILVLTCVHKRPEIFDIFLTSYLKNVEAFEGIIDFKLIVAGDLTNDTENWRVFEKHFKNNDYKLKRMWLHAENNPLSDKWNNLTEISRHENFDFILITGSDNIFSNATFLSYYQLAKQGHDYIGFTDFFMVNTPTLQMKHWGGFFKDRKGQTIGAGRLIKRNLIEQVNYKLWAEGLNNGLDHSMTGILKPENPKTLSCGINAVGMIDLKSEINIWGYDAHGWQGAPVEFGQVIPAFFEREIVTKIVEVFKAKSAKNADRIPV